MCYRYTLTAPPDVVAVLFGLPVVPDLAPRYNVALSQPVAVVGLKADGRTRGLALMRWGFIPRWAETDDGPRPGNAKAETVARKDPFRDSFRDRRCLVPADGFYEWVAAGGKKQPYHVRRRDRQP